MVFAAGSNHRVERAIPEGAPQAEEAADNCIEDLFGEVPLEHGQAE